jgi:hypothetical protein
LHVLYEYAAQKNDSYPEPDGAGWCEISPTIENGVQFKTYELLISRIFLLIVLDCG